MIEADKLYEQAMALREKVSTLPWREHLSGSDGVYLFPDTGNKREDLKYVAKVDGRDLLTDQKHSACIVAAVNLLDALPKLKAKWEREARLDEQRKHGGHMADCKYLIRNEPTTSCTCGYIERIAALQQPAAQAKEERT